MTNDTLITTNTELKIKLEELEKLRDKKTVLETMVRSLEKRLMTDEIKFKQDNDKMEIDLRDTKTKNERYTRDFDNMTNEIKKLKEIN